MNTHYRWLIQQSKPARRWLFTATLLSIFAGLLIIAQAGILAHLINHVYLHNASRTALVVSFSLLPCVILLRALLTYLRELSGFKAATLIKKAARNRLMQHFFQLSPTQITQQKTGEVTSLLIEHIEALHNFFADYLPQMTIAVVLPIVIMIFVFTKNWVAGFILLFTAPLIPLFMALIGMGTEKLNQQHFQALSRMSGHFLDLLQGLTTLTLFDRAREQTNNIVKTTDDYREKTMRILRIAFLSTASLELFSTVAIAIIAVYLGLGLLGFIKIGFGAPISLQSALFILLVAPEFFAPLRQLGTHYHARSEALGAVNDILRFLDMPADLKLTGTTHTFSSNAMTLSFDNVHFSYHTNQTLLSNVSTTFKKGECVGLFGESGSGKSTMLALAAKLLTPHSGKIIVNGRDIQSISSDDWRAHIALLHQHPRLFHASILDNIRFAKPDASLNEIEKAMRMTGVLDFTKNLPDSYHSMIHENNAGLSGGQIQRIALARIYLKNAPLILLDEPTTYLDKENIAILLTLLSEWRGKKTVVVASHDKTLQGVMDRVITVGSDFI